MCRENFPLVKADVLAPPRKSLAYATRATRCGGRFAFKGAEEAGLKSARKRVRRDRHG